MILITGCDGFIGRNLLNRLVDEGKEEVVGIEKNMVPELLNKDMMIKFLSVHGFSGIYHVGAITDTSYVEADIYWYNTLFSKVLFDAARQLNIFVVYSSSAAVYGTPDHPHPTNHYAWSKYLAEMSLGANGTSLRYFNVYGPGENKKGRMASVAYQSWLVNKEKEPFRLFKGSRDYKRDFIHVDDVVEANIHAMNRRFLGVYDVGTGHPKSFVEVLDVFGADYIVDESKEAPIGYQKYTRASKDMFLPYWKPRLAPNHGFSSYKNYLENSVERVDI